MPTKTFRLLITGSRSWTDLGMIRNALELVDERKSNVVLVSGHARGADKMCEEIAESLGWGIEIHPVSSVEWARYGKRAGMLRNELMVELGADLCIAFIKDESSGATMCAKFAQDSGIKTMRFTK